MIKQYFFKKGLLVLLTFALGISDAQAQTAKQGRYNVIFILSDDHRYDFMGFMHKVPGLKTPNMDRLALEGAHLQNAFVTTSLCSPSRASILTGQYAHTHTVVDNQAPMPKGLVFFPEYLQKAGYHTAFLGKWHMGNTNGAPQPGFDEWISFKGQGVYMDPALNINGKPVKKQGYITDLLTDYALGWLDTISRDKPFFLYLSHKAVHAMFNPGKKYDGVYKDMPIICPPSMYLTATDSSRYYGKQTGPQTPVNYADIPVWVRRQRYSWHGVDHLYDGNMQFETFYRKYCETLLGIDESIGRVLQWLKDHHMDKNTLVVYMGDNGFQFGEHGLIDKRDMYETSIRVPLLAWCPSLIRPGTKVKQMVENIDIAPTVLDLAGIAEPAQMQGKSFLPLLEGKQTAWRKEIFYEYYWEWAFPMTPTIFGIRTDRYKYIYNWGVWDINELYDLQNDPEEMNNLIRDPKYHAIAKSLKKDLWDWLDKTKGMEIPLKKNDAKRNHIPYQDTY
ncbi:sulfatase [Compostibacter hankyongensis]|uniref:Sulfatase n=1 Tax=Compostibacter hankyongensis TaxID=1007089 RepID=A0ABP8FK61_9BACT